jgi:urease accessory protein
MSNHQLFHLLHLADATLPIGGFSHSAGLETYVQKGIVCSHKTAEKFIVGQLSRNIRYTDAAIVSLAFTAVKNNDWEALVKLDGLCTAVKLPREIREASQKIGIRLLKIFEPVFNENIAAEYKASVYNKRLLGHYCIVFGMYSALLKISKADALVAFYYNAAVSMVTNSVKLIPLGQQEGQKLLFSLSELINTLANDSLDPDVDLIGLCCSGFDIRSMQHEQLYSRLYMS